MKSPRLPFVSVNLAITADGKIAPSTRRFEPFTSRADQLRMLDLRARADAVLCGARTVENGKVTLGTGGPKYRQRRVEAGLREHPCRVIVSGSGSVDPKAHIFSTSRRSPIILLTSLAAPQERIELLEKVFDGIFISPGQTVDFRLSFQWLAERLHVRHLLCEGGGEVNAPIFRERLADELHLTIAPVIFGGRTAPTLCDGEGIEHLADAAQLRLKHREQAGAELYCIYKFLKARERVVSV